MPTCLSKAQRAQRRWHSRGSMETTWKVSTTYYNMVWNYLLVILYSMWVGWFCLMLLFLSAGTLKAHHFPPCELQDPPWKDQCEYLSPSGYKVWRTYMAICSLYVHAVNDNHPIVQHKIHGNWSLPTLNLNLKLSLPGRILNHRNPTPLRCWYWYCYLPSVQTST